MQRMRIPPAVALMILLLALVLIALLTIPVIDISVRGLQQKLPTYQVVLQRHFEEVILWLEGLDTGMNNQELRALLDWRSTFAFARTSLAKATGLISQTLFVLVLTAFILLEAQNLPRKLRGMPEFSPAFWEQLERVARDVRGYMSMKTITSLLTGGTLVLALVLALGIDFAPLLGFLAFVLNYIPIKGFLSGKGRRRRGIQLQPEPIAQKPPDLGLQLVQREYGPILQHAPQQGAQYLMIDRGEEAPYIALEHVKPPARKRLGAVNRGMAALPAATDIAVVTSTALEHRLQPCSRSISNAWTVGRSRLPRAARRSASSKLRKLTMSGNRPPARFIVGDSPWSAAAIPGTASRP